MILRIRDLLGYTLYTIVVSLVGEADMDEFIDPFVVTKSG